MDLPDIVHHDETLSLVRVCKIFAPPWRYTALFAAPSA